MAQIRPMLNHVGIFVRDLPRMERFYARALGLVVTDRGKGRSMPHDLVFMSGDASMHHQLVLASGRPADGVTTVNQLSFRVPALGDIRAIRDRALAEGATDARGINHGNAWSVYMRDPEGNTVEIYADSPFYIPQPFGDPLDLSLSDAEILTATEERCRPIEGFVTRAEWQAELARRLAEPVPA
ncbi:MAG: VOC family protein [Alphaproteobacteria bacterium]